MNLKRTTMVYWTAFSVFLWALAHWDWAWFIYSVLIHIVVISLFSGVIHRYFCHRAYEANSWVMWILGTIPLCYGYASPAGWPGMHNAHHAYSDTDKDPHVKNWRSLVSVYYRPQPPGFSLMSKWFYDRKHEVLHRYALLFIVGTAVIFLISGWEKFVWLYAIPVFTLQFGNGLHRTCSHKFGQVGAANRWYLEYLYPMGGEWMHDEHHNDAKKSKFSNRWYEYDIGYIWVWLFGKPGTYRIKSLKKID